eukprot:NODE_7_length_48057_cov_0.322240.p14 type:complete len:286 gc:universal NODE_7_length_48057_cov_0.322240:21419-22276(+)
MSLMDFGLLCSKSTLPVCPLYKPDVIANCYARNADLGSVLIFQPALGMVYLGALLMASIMLYNIKQKYTAVGRREISWFMYIYIITIILEALVNHGFFPSQNIVYQIICALYIGHVLGLFGVLFYNGLVPLQLIEDGTNKSMIILWTIYAVCVALGAVVGFITFNSNGTIVFLLINLVPLLIVVLYSCIQVYIVLTRLDNKWPLGALVFGLLFFVIAIGFLFTSDLVCIQASHYLDGLFFTALFMLLAVMMLYKYWDSITKEDLEFSVGGNNNWETKRLIDDSYE